MKISPARIFKSPIRTSFVKYWNEPIVAVGSNLKASFHKFENNSISWVFSVVKAAKS